MKGIKRAGLTTYTREREILLGEDYVTEVQELAIDWECEISEYGDGSTDIEFEATATDEMGETVELSQADQDNIYTQLHSEGAFA